MVENHRAIKDALGVNSYPTSRTMRQIFSHKDWLFCTNSFRYDSPDRPGLFVEDREFSLKNYQDIITNNNRNNSEIALSLSMPLQNTLCSHPLQSDHTQNGPTQNNISPVRNYIDHLLSEIKLVSTLIPKTRSVNYIHWQGDIAQLLSPAEMTEIMYSLNKAFTLQSEQQGTYVLELEKVPADDAIIALIKGLGFSHICLGTQNRNKEPIDFSFLSEQVSIFKQYGFKTVNVRFLIGKHENCGQLSKKLDGLIAINPDTIYLINEDEHQSVLSGIEAGNEKNKIRCDCHNKLEQKLINAGYQKLNHVKFSKDSSVSKGISGDLIGLGLGATSLIENAFAHNFDQLDQYYQKLEQHQLPFSYGGYIRPK
jgi:oxygen-independent coproporphyrinogen III oxidase